MARLYYTALRPGIGTAISAGAALLRVTNAGHAVGVSGSAGAAYLSKTHAMLATGAGQSLGVIHYGETVSASATGIAGSVARSAMLPVLNAPGSATVIWIMRVR